MPAKKRKVATPKLPMQRQFAFPEQGKFFNLRAIFDKLNAKYFRKRLQNYMIVWAASAKAVHGTKSSSAPSRKTTA